jgi:hypothetical protein
MKKPGPKTPDGNKSRQIAVRMTDQEYDRFERLRVRLGLRKLSDVFRRLWAVGLKEIEPKDGE